MHADEELKERVHTFQVDLTNKRAVYDVAKEVAKDIGTIVRNSNIALMFGHQKRGSNWRINRTCSSTTLEWSVVSPYWKRQTKKYSAR